MIRTVQQVIDGQELVLVELSTPEEAATLKCPAGTSHFWEFQGKRIYEAGAVLAIIHTAVVSGKWNAEFLSEANTNAQTSRVIKEQRELVLRTMDQQAEMYRNDPNLSVEMRAHLLKSVRDAKLFMARALQVARLEKTAAASRMLTPLESVVEMEEAQRGHQ